MVKRQKKKKWKKKKTKKRKKSAGTRSENNAEVLKGCMEGGMCFKEVNCD